jgi:hypothetical protein
MADLNQNIECGLARKGFGLSPKEDKNGLGCGKEDGCNLSYTIDESWVWQV